MTALWVTVALMTGAAVFVVLGSLARHRSGAAVDASAADVAVYRDQIDEISRDRARGLIDEREEESAKTEVARRLIAATDRVAGEASPASANDRRRRIAAIVALVFVPLVALGGYASLGRPELRDQPLASRDKESPDRANVANLISRVEDALAKNPKDGRGWEVLAPIYLRVGRSADAANAYANAIKYLGSTPEREADYGEALFAAADGVVTAEARQAFDKSVAGDQPSVKGAVYLARASAQDGDTAGALGKLKALLAKAPADAPYVEAVKNELQQLADVPQLPMPKAEESAEKKTPEERMAMIRTMVDGLDGKLASDQGADLGQWLQLVRARAALGDVEKAKATLATAREKFGADGRAAARLDALALGLGLEGGGA